MRSKRIPALLIVLALMLSLAACGGGDGGSKKSDKSDRDDRDDSGSVADRFDEITGGNEDEDKDEDEDRNPTPDPEPEPEPNPEPEPEPKPEDLLPPEDTDEYTDEYWLEKAAQLNENTAEKCEAYGDYFTWYYGDGVMVIRGTGALERVIDPNDPYNYIFISEIIEQFTEGDIVVVIDDGCTAIGTQVFSGAPSRLTKVILPDSVKVLEDRAFENCLGPTSITLPQSVAVILGFPFYASDLTEITMPDDPLYVFYGAVMGCFKLKTVTWRGTTYDSSDSFIEAVEAAGIPIVGDAPTFDARTGEMD